MNQPVELLRDLVAIPSVSSQTNEAVIRYAEKWLGERRWKLQRQTYRGAGGVEKINLVASTSAQMRDIELALCGPGDMRVAHGRDERIATEDLLACETMLRAMINRFCIDVK